VALSWLDSWPVVSNEEEADMSGTVYVFSRRAGGAAGRTYRECATVFAEDVESAREVLRETFSQFAKDERNDVAPAYRPDSPEWRVYEVPLYGPRIVTWHMTLDTR
jgi:hypothetical protein